MVTQCPQCGLTVDGETARCLRCGKELDGAAQVLVDGRYAVEGEIGQGSMGVVYRARDVGLGRLVALKMIARDFARNAPFVDRFRQEAAALASIRNDHVVQVYALGTHEGSWFYAMEYVEGRNLEDIIHDHGQHGTYVPTYRALTILRQVAQGLAAVHAAGIVHRDVKPANIVIEEGTGRPVLLDFGLARPARAVRATAISGSPPYMAPEQIAPSGIPGLSGPQSISPRTDVYALACSAFELLTGQTPFESDDVYVVLDRQVHEAPPRISNLRRDLAPLDTVLIRALAKNPADRYASATAFADALDEAAVRWRASNATIPPPGTAATGPGADGALRVLVVDDDPSFCSFAARAAQLALPHVRVEVTVANSGLRALTAALRAAPHLVVLDYDMPGLNGIETLSELRALPRVAPSQVLVVSSSVGAVERWRFGVLGVKDFLQKPATLRDLVDAIARLTRRARAGIAATAPSVEPTSIPAPDPGVPFSVPRSTQATGDTTVSEPALPVEVFLMLLAVGWADGSLDPQERDAVLHAARASGVEPTDFADIERAAETPVELGAVDISRLSRRDRFYVYAMARWIAAVNGTITEHEDAMLHVLAFVLGLSARGRAQMDDAVRDLLSSPEAGQPTRFDLHGLRSAISARVAAAEAAESRIPRTVSD